MRKIEFDNHDERIRYYELLLERDLEQIPRRELPQGYRFVFIKRETGIRGLTLRSLQKSLPVTSKG